MIRILIADDHTIVREGLKQVFVETAGMTVADEASNGQEVLSKVRRNNYDIVLLDISLPGMSGLDVLKQLKSTKPKLPVLILSIHPEEQYAVRSIRAGASGYLTKDSAMDELIKAVRKIVKGGKYITDSLAQRIAVEIDVKTEKPIHESLSDREYQILCLIASGKTPTEIAKMLSLSTKTVSTHRARILRKMKMSNNAQLMRHALKHNLVD